MSTKLPINTSSALLRSLWHKQIMLIGEKSHDQKEKLFIRFAEMKGQQEEWWW